MSQAEGDKSQKPQSSKLWTSTKVCVILVNYTVLRAPRLLLTSPSLFPGAGAFRKALLSLKVYEWLTDSPG